MDRIVEGRMDFNAFPLLICVMKDRKVYSLNNRRLFVARVLEAKGSLPTIHVDIVPFMHPRVQSIRDGRPKWDRAFSTRNGGLTVLVDSRYRNLQLHYESFHTESAAASVKYPREVPVEEGVSESLPTESVAASVKYPREVPVEEGVPAGWKAIERIYGPRSQSCGKTYVRYFSLDGKHKHVVSAKKVIEIEASLKVTSEQSLGAPNKRLRTQHL